MIETAARLAGDHLSKAMIEEICGRRGALLAHPVDLFDDVVDTLAAMALRGQLILIMKGDLLHQESKLAASGQGDLLSGLEIVSDKTENTLRRVFALFGVAPDEAIMADNSMCSDIHPSLEARAWAAYIPQKPSGSLRSQRCRPRSRFCQLDRLTQLPDLIDTIG